MVANSAADEIHVQPGSYSITSSAILAIRMKLRLDHFLSLSPNQLPSVSMNMANIPQGSLLGC